MIKTAQDAYIAGRQAAMMKLADLRPDEVGGMSLPGGEEESLLQSVLGGEVEGNEYPMSSELPPDPTLLEKIKAMGALAGSNQMDVFRNIGLTGQGLSRNQQLAAQNATGGYRGYDPMNYATMENLSRAGMLGGAAGGAYLGGMDPRAAAIASAGALGGGVVGGNLGQGINEAIKALGYGGDRRMATSIGGALGGLGGGLGAGYMAR